MIIRHFKTHYPYLWIVLVFSLMILNLILFCAGAAVYICGIFSLLSIVISFLYYCASTFYCFLGCKDFQMCEILREKKKSILMMQKLMICFMIPLD